MASQLLLYNITYSISLNLTEKKKNNLLKFVQLSYIYIYMILHCKLDPLQKGKKTQKTSFQKHPIALIILELCNERDKTFCEL